MFVEAVGSEWGWVAAAEKLVGGLFADGLRLACGCKGRAGKGRADGDVAGPWRWQAPVPSPRN